jgi:hypothetical protein
MGASVISQPTIPIYKQCAVFKSLGCSYKKTFDDFRDKNEFTGAITGI